MSPPATGTGVTVMRAGSAQLTLRRLILYVLLFALVVIAASGLAGLLERFFSSGAVLASADVAGLARSLAFTLIGGPLAVLLWWFVWKRLDDDAERAAPGWGLYLAGIYTVSLILFTTALLGMAASFISGRPEPRWYSPLAVGLVWAGVWAWHRWMWRHPHKRPTNLEDIPAVIGSVFGLLLGAGAAITALGALVDIAIRGFTSLTPAVEPWWQPILRALLWAAGGIAIWWWHWIKGGGRSLQSTLMNVAIIGVGIFLAGISALAGAGVVLFVLLRLALDRGDPLGELLAPLAPALSAAAVGVLVWRYHSTIAEVRSDGTKRASLLVTSGVALAATASGIGVIINSALAMAVSPLVERGTRALLLGGISSLLVGGIVWWQAWKPTGLPRTADAIPPGRRIYLVAFFGISAVVALISLLVIAYRLFEFLLGNVFGGSLVDSIRAPLGLLVAAGLVAGYHFVQWRRERELLAASAPAVTRTIGQVTLVTGSDPGPLSQAIAETTGATVAVWRWAGLAPEPQPSLPGSGPLIEQVTEALIGITAGHVLLVVGPGTRIQVIPVESGATG